MHPLATSAPVSSSDPALVDTASTTPLRSLVLHQVFLVPGHTTIEAQEILIQHDLHFAPVVENQRPFGLVSRHVLDTLLGQRSGLGAALYGKRPVTEFLSDHEVCVRESCPLPDLLANVFARRGPDFFDDVLLTDDHDLYVGMIPVRTLIRLQNRLLLEKNTLLGQARDHLDLVNNELAAARDAALGAARAKSEFLANMSHEIRTPLNAVIGMAALLRTTALNREQREFAETIHGAGEALLELINEVLDFSKIESGRLEIEQLPFQLRTIVDSALGVIGPAARAKQLTLEAWVDASVPDQLLGDRTRLRQILVNLLGNAVKFTTDGSVVLTVTQGSGNQLPAPSLFVTVTDTGIGIPADRMHRLFQSFSQVDSSTTRLYGGTGLGLAITRQLVELMGGHVWVESEVGHGSRFCFVIPLRCDPAVNGQRTRHRLHGRRILLVNTSATARECLSRVLESEGATVTTACSALEVRAAAWAGARHDAWLLAHDYPQLDALALAAQLREVTGDTTVPCVLIAPSGTDLPPEQLALVTAIHHLPLKCADLDPLVYQLAAIHTAPAASLGATPGFVHLPISPGEVRLLLVEDNLVNQRVIMAMLGRLGLAATITSNGREALDALRANPHTHVLMDVQMPEMDGLTATRHIRAQPEHYGHPCILGLTANATPSDRDTCLQAGMDDYLTKPIRMEVLRERLVRWTRATDVTIAV